MPDKMGRLIAEFSARVRRYKNREMSKADAVTGLTERDLAILELVNDRQQATFAEVAKELQLADIPQTSPSTLSQTISSLCMKQGLVTKDHNPKDQRQPIISLTPKGKNVVEKVRDIRLDFLSKVKQSMDLSEQEAHMFQTAMQRGINYFDKLLHNSE